MWVGVVVELDVVEGVELDPQAASTSAADATAVPSTASPLSFRFRNMIVPDLLVSTALVTSFDGWQKRAIAPRTRIYRDQSTASVMSVRTCIFAGPYRHYRCGTLISINSRPGGDGPLLPAIETSHERC